MAPICLQKLVFEIEQEFYILHVRSRMTEGSYSMTCTSNGCYRGRVRSCTTDGSYSKAYRSNGYYRGSLQCDTYAHKVKEISFPTAVVACKIL